MAPRLGGGTVYGVIFDLDGTLIDSAADLHSSINIVLAQRGLPELSLPQVVSMIGHGVRKLVERAFAASGKPLQDEALDAAYDEMVGVYDARLTELTTLMPGADAAVRELSSAGVRLGVVTNKPHAATETILAHFGLLDPMLIVMGGDSGLPRKPAPDMLEVALYKLGLDPGQVVMVGDSPADIDCARAAGVRSIAVRGGYTQKPADELGADLVIGSLADLADALPLPNA